MIDRNEVLALAGKWRVDADEYTKIGCIGLSAIKQDCADELEALAAKAEPQGGEVSEPEIYGEPDPMDVDHVPISAFDCIQWLDAKYRRHGEIEDKAAAEWLRYYTHPAPKPAEGEGWVLVPAVATPEMIEAMWDANGGHDKQWADALAAAPKKGEG